MTTIDMTTYAGQAAHYAAVKSRLGRPMPVLSGIDPQVRRSVLVRKPAAPVPQKIHPRYGCPFNFLSPHQGRNIILLVALKTGVSFDEIIGPRKTRVICAARHQAVYLVHTHCQHLSLPSIGRLFGDRDHSTIIASLGTKIKGTKSRLVPLFSPLTARAENPAFAGLSHANHCTV